MTQLNLYHKKRKVKTYWFSYTQTHFNKKCKWMEIQIQGSRETQYLDPHEGTLKKMDTQDKKRDCNNINMAKITKKP